MAGNEPARARKPRSENRRILVCLPDLRARNRLITAFRDHAELCWFVDFDSLRAELGKEQPDTAAIVIAMADPAGRTANAFAHDVSGKLSGIPLLVYADLGRASQAEFCALGALGVHDLLITGVNDDGFTARSIVFGAARVSAADLVLREVAGVIPVRLRRFVEVAVRKPQAIRRITDLAEELRVSRQSVSTWCRAERFVRPEELLVWSRLFLVAALLEITPRTLESIALELNYASATALRNRIKDYTGLTSTKVRECGVTMMVSVFERRLEQVRSGFAGRW